MIKFWDKIGGDNTALKQNQFKQVIVMKSGVL